MLSKSWVIALALLSTTTVARADDDRGEAKALLASGLKLYQAKDYNGALQIFRDAYARFPSAKLLLNIATTLTKLDKKAEAANTYQKYLDSADADATKKADVAKVLADLDKSVGTLAISTSAPTTGATVQVDGSDEWVALPATIRVTPGDLVVRVKANGYLEGKVNAHANVGETTPLAVSLSLVPTRPVAPPPPPKIVAAPVWERSPIGVFLYGHVDIAHDGAAGLLGATYDVVPHLEVQAAALVGGKPGGYVGVSVPILWEGRIRPLVSVGMPVFVSNGARFAVRGAAGVEIVIDHHFAVYAEIGGEHVFKPEMDVVANLLVPAAGVTGRFW